MPALFAFVNVPLNEEALNSKSRRRAISDKDSVVIRSLAARNSERRSQNSADAVDGKKRRTRARKPKKVADNTSSREKASSEECDFGATFSDDIYGHSQVCDLDADSSMLGIYPASSSSDLSDAEGYISEEFSDPGEIIPYIRRDTGVEILDFEQKAQEEVTKFCSRIVSHVRTGKLDPFWTLSIPYTPALSKALHHRLTYLSPSYPELDKSFGECASRKYVIISMHNAAATLTSLLFSATNLYMLGQDPTSASFIRETDLIWLKGITYNALRSDLMKPNKTIDDLDQAIAALMSIACYEYCFEDSQGLFHMHIAALLEVIKQRGGLGNIHHLHRTLLQYMDLLRLVTDSEGSLHEIASRADGTNAIRDPVSPETVMGLIEDPQPYTIAWVNFRTASIGSSIVKRCKIGI